jgi:hypothetical protein
MKKSLLLCFLILNNFLLLGQSSFIPQKLKGGVNTEYSDINPVISPDGKTLYFNRINHPENTFGKDESMDIWYAKLLPDGSWSQAKHLPFPLNTARNNGIVSISQDGKELVVSGIYSKKNVKWKKRGLSTVAITGDSSWDKPKKIKIPAYSKQNKGAVSNAYMSTDQNTLLFTYTKKWNREVLDIFISRKSSKGKWGKPKKIRNINDYGSIAVLFSQPL